ncbi:MAG: type II toxin-antitoxin system PemK/MazF family toxin [Thiobacillus sp.]|nr:type II toxin-antitoxin system PemK/MazF family toxin [Thiobacillus sp.]
MVKRGEVYWVNLDPTVGSEIRKTRPALIVSPDDMNAALPRVIVARSVDKKRLGSRIGKIDLALWHPVLLEMLAF